MELFNQQRMAYPLISQQMALGNFQNQPFNPLISQPVTGVETNQATSGMQGGAQSNTKPAKVKGTRGRKKKVENDNTKKKKGKKTPKKKPNPESDQTSLHPASSARRAG